ncbi:hypothetical protein HJC23_003795 [Cyclotella cryptica]|uniref:Uncharacterized protein n=1 Tax=Cyclotella cryptica TaxID=29204 RepID=A0ABD3PYX7_9STRA|eukprot:CCRYP_009940-RA/>CCRYP_009940-RA protein AED:0.31 eAED:0.31 QI:0/-1/0/1/-1/1/1/0/188
MTITAYLKIESDFEKCTADGLDDLSDSSTSLSDSETDLSFSSRLEDDEPSVFQTSSDGVLDGHTPKRRKKSVRFSLVQTREYNVIDELPSPLDHEDEAPRRSLGWNFTERQIDIDTHLAEVMRQRKEECARLIHQHIIRAEIEREEKKKEKKLKKKGFKAMIKRALKPVGEGFLEAATRTNFMLASSY